MLSRPFFSESISGASHKATFNFCRINAKPYFQECLKTYFFLQGLLFPLIQTHAQAFICLIVH